jgi:hypothetical protein
MAGTLDFATPIKIGNKKLSRFHAKPFRHLPPDPKTMPIFLRKILIGGR